MADAKVMATSVILDNNDYKFTSSGQVGIFDGYLKVYGEFEESKDTYYVSLGKRLTVARGTYYRLRSEHFVYKGKNFEETTCFTDGIMID